MGHQNSNGNLVGASWVGTDPTGQFVFVTNQDGNSVTSYGINSTTGLLTVITSGLALNTDPMVYVGPDWGSVDPSGHFLFTTDQGLSEQVSAVKINTNGSLSRIGDLDITKGSGSQPGLIKDHNFAYIGNGSTVSSFSLDVNAGTVTFSQALATNPGAGGTQGSQH